MSTGSLLLFFKVRLYLFQEELRVIRRFYRSWRFALFDVAFKLHYCLCNPYRLCRKAKGLYGETPLTTWAKIAKLARLESDDLFLDLGCGRGRLCFWSSLIIGCRSLGVDTIKPFISKARLLSFFVPKSSFVHGRIKDAPLANATVIYLYTFDSEEDRVAFTKLASGARVITVSEPLENASFTVTCKESVCFPWGETEVFIHQKL